MQVSKWGNSLAVRLPASVVEALGLKEGDDIQIEVAGARAFEVRKTPEAGNCSPDCESTAAACPPISRSTGSKPMSAGEQFFDTNVLLYLLSGDAAKADRAEELISGGGVISVQVLNEFAAVASRKLGMAWPEIREILAQLRAVCHIVPLDLETHEVGLHLAERRQLPFYDALIVASALRAGCKVLYSEDFQDGQSFERQLSVRNPFREA